MLGLSLQSVSTQTLQGGITTNAYTDRTGLSSITFTVGDVPWIVIGNETHLYSTASGSLAILAIRDEANVVKEAVVGIFTSTAYGSIYYGSISSVIERITVPGTYTRKLSVSNSTSIGSITFAGGVPFTARLRAYCDQ